RSAAAEAIVALAGCRCEFGVWPYTTSPTDSTATKPRTGNFFFIVDRSKNRPTSMTPEASTALSPIQASASFATLHSRLKVTQKALQRKQSLNQVILDELTAATTGRPRRADFSDLVGRWTPDPAFDEILASQRQIDWDKWKRE